MASQDLKLNNQSLPKIITVVDHYIKFQAIAPYNSSIMATVTFTTRLKTPISKLPISPICPLWIYCATVARFRVLVQNLRSDVLFVGQSVREIVTGDGDVVAGVVDLSHVVTGEVVVLLV